MQPQNGTSRKDKVLFWQFMKDFKQDILSDQPKQLYFARVTEFRTLFFRPYLINQPALIRLALKERSEDFPNLIEWVRGCAHHLEKVFFLQMKGFEKTAAHYLSHL